MKGMVRRYPELKAEYADLHRQPVTSNYSGMPVSGGACRATEEVAIRELPTTRQREYEAVRRAIAATERMKSSRDRMKVIDLVFWKRSHTLEGAALMVPCHYKTAQKWHREFIELTAKFYGLMDD